MERCFNETLSHAICVVENRDWISENKNEKKGMLHIDM